MSNHIKMDIKRSIVEELHKPAKKSFKRRHVIIKGLSDLMQLDLVEMIPFSSVNKGYKYILMAINVFSKMLWAKPLKTKTGEEVTKAMKQILEDAKYKPKNVQTDRGKEFYNKYFKELMDKNNINHYSTFSNLKASIVERSNRTIKNRMWKEFSYQGNYRWLPLLDKIVSEYNHTTHSTTGFKPVDVNKRNEKQILMSAYSHLKTLDPKNAKFKVGDKVRISKYREAFKKGYTPNWSNEIFRLRKVLFTNPRTYLLEDEHGNNIDGGFYEAELQKVKYPDIFLVQQVIKKRGNKVYVKWMGFDSSHNSWIAKSDIV